MFTRSMKTAIHKTNVEMAMVPVKVVRKRMHRGRNNSD